MEEWKEGLKQQGPLQGKGMPVDSSVDNPLSLLLMRRE